MAKKSIWGEMVPEKEGWYWLKGGKRIGKRPCYVFKHGSTGRQNYYVVMSGHKMWVTGDRRVKGLKFGPELIPPEG